jgi:acetolactate synthase-1/2/3 large subunit
MPDLGAVAEAIGIPHAFIDSQQQLNSRLERAIGSQGPMICIARLMADESLWPKAAAIPQKDGSMLSMPLEDMTPLLPLERLKNEMLTPILESSLRARAKNS